nr:dockerin type I domain-containing protein [Dehalobacterium formicoaceticum]
MNKRPFQNGEAFYAEVRVIARKAHAGCDYLPTSGDVNNDGQVNILDVVMTINFLLEKNTPNEAEFIDKKYH